MKTKLIALTALTFSTWLVPAISWAAETGKGYEAYATVRTRNVFDPNRRVVREVPPPRSSGPSQPRSSSFTLTGTLVRDGRSLAFFSGSRSEFSKVISVGDSVANYRITAIDPAKVELEKDGRKVTLDVGRNFQIELPPGMAPDPEPPAASADKPPTSETAPSAPNTGAAPTTSSSGTPPAGSDAKAEILRRMMERRAKEMNK